jgi:Guanine nucleotide exchange factor synembryn
LLTMAADPAGLADRLLVALAQGDTCPDSQLGPRDGLTGDDAARRSDPESLLIRWNEDIERFLLDPVALRHDSHGEGGDGHDDGDDDGANGDRVQRATSQLAISLVECLRQFAAATYPSLPPQPPERESGGGGGGGGDNGRQPQQLQSSLTAASIRGAAGRVVSMLEDRNVLNRSADSSSPSRILCDGRRDHPHRAATEEREDESGVRRSARAGLSLRLRSSKNWLRYLLVHHPRRPGVTEGDEDDSIQDGDDASAFGSRDYRHAFQSMPMLTLYLFLMDWYCADLHNDRGVDRSATSDEGDGRIQKNDDNIGLSANDSSGESLRCAALLLFYATFDQDDGPSLPPDSFLRRGEPALSPLQRCVANLIQQHRVLERLLTYLLCVPSSALAVALARNVHHFVVASNRLLTRQQHGHEHALQAISVRLRRPLLEDGSDAPTGAPTAEEIGVRPSDSPMEWRAPWAKAAAEWDPASVRASDDGSVEFTYEAVLVEIVLWCLPPPGSSADGAAGDGTNAERDDRRSELALEIMRIFYVTRLGTRLYADCSSNSTPHQRRAAMVLQLLQLQPSDAGPSANPPWLEVQDSAIALLMDVHPRFASTVFDAPTALESLLRALERHVTQTVSSTRVDDSGAAALTPVLAVLLKFCQAHSGFRSATKAFVFPNPLPESARSAATTTIQGESKAPDPSGGAKNMKPSDAPEGTLRANLIRLLTWPQGHIKRFAGELLWVLCGQDSAEFVRRVGMGNAMVVLGSKGLVNLPSHVFE